MPNRVRGGALSAASSRAGKSLVSEGSTRERVLGFLREYPTAWRAAMLARRLRVPAETLRQTLAQLRQEGLLVSCTVTVPRQRPRVEYRIAAHTQAVDLYKFVINKNASTARAASRSASAKRLGAKATRF